MTRSSLFLFRQIDAVCSDFEASWGTEDHRPIEAILNEVPPASQSLLLAELIALEYELRFANGEAVDLTEYEQRFLQDSKAVKAAVLRINEAGTPDALCQLHESSKTRLPRERLILGEQIGAGGMGKIIQARDSQLDRDLAVKVLSENLQNRREAVERFVREARICARLQHPGIIPVYELGWLDARPYLAMKLVTGQSLADLLQDRPHPEVDLPRLLECFERVCETMAYAHSQGVIHRDLKPANVLIGSFGEVYVIDWGLARHLSEDEETGGVSGKDNSADGADTHNLGSDESLELRLDSANRIPENVPTSWTFLGDIVGTPEYMSPEQACGDAEAVDQRADVFALGSTLCEILTGAPAYQDGDRAARLERAQLGELTEAMERLECCSADRELIDLARDCLAADPVERPTDAGCVSERLSAFLRGLQERLRAVELERVGVQARADERRRRRKVVLLLAGSIFLLAISLGAGTIWVAQTESARRLAETRQRERLNERLEETLSEVAQLYANAPKDWREDPLRRTKIRELARRAETLAESPQAASAHVQNVFELRERILAEDADHRLLDRLENIRLKRAEVNPRTNKFATGRTRPMYRWAFNDYGLDLVEIDAAQAVAKIRGRPPHVVEACIFGLESWRSLFRSNGAPPSQWIDTVLDGIDDNPWRQKVRAACRVKNWNVVDDLIRAIQNDLPSVDSVSLVAMELMNASQFDLTIQLLLTVQPSYPGDFWINHYLALAYFLHPDPQLEESVRFATAALAIRETETSYLTLGISFFELGRYAEAEQAFRSAVGLQPDYVQAHLSLADVLERQGQTEEAAAERERAAQLQETK